MQRGRTPKGDHGIFGKVLAVLDGMNTRGIGHVFVDHFGQAKRSSDGIHIKGLAQRSDQRGLCICNGQANGPPGETIGVELPKY